MIPSQMWKGILDGCVLKVISREETYGYEISEALKALWVYGDCRGHHLPAAFAPGAQRADCRHLPRVAGRPQTQVFFHYGRRFNRTCYLL